MTTEIRRVCDACGRDIDKDPVSITVYGMGRTFQSDNDYDLHEKCAVPVLKKIEQQLLPESRKLEVSHSKR